MTLTRTIFIALAILLPTTWTVARAGDEGAGTTTESTTKTTKKTKKSKKTDGVGGTKTETETKTETK